jgi:hypothetical protein
MSIGKGGYANALWVVALIAAVGCARESNRRATGDAPAPSVTRAAPVAKQAHVPPVQVPEAIVNACRRICGRSVELKCTHASECEPNCVATASATPCAAAFSTFYDCLVRQPLQNFQCDEDGVAAVREGFCDNEQAAAVRCMEAKMQP